MATSKRDRNRRWLALSLCLVAFAAYAYDTAATRGLGKVHRAIRHNYLPGVGDVVVTEAFDYAGVGGRVSSVRTTNTVNDLEFQTSQTYDALGRARDLIYPTCLVSANCPSEPLTVRSTYTALDLTLTTYTGLWTQAVDPLNMPIARDSGSGTSWLAVYTASEERLATLDASSGGSSVQHWTLRSPSGQVLRDFRFGLPAGGDAVFCDGFESGDTGGWESAVGVRGPPAPAVKGTCGAGSTPEWTVHTSYVYRGDSLLAEINQGDLRFYHLDHLGSVRQLTNVEADVAASYDYLPYGKEVGSST